MSCHNIRGLCKFSPTSQCNRLVSPCLNLCLSFPHGSPSLFPDVSLTLFTGLFLGYFIGHSDFFSDQCAVERKVRVRMQKREREREWEKTRTKQCCNCKIHKYLMTWYVWTYFDKKVKQTSHPDHRNMFIVQVQYNFPHIFLCPSYPFLLVTSGQGADQRTVFTSCRGPKRRIKNSKTKTQTEREWERESATT